MTEQKNTCSALKNKTHSGAARGGRRWYEYLWIVSLAYLILGFFNILFAWLGLLCFFIPLLIAAAGGERLTATGTAAEDSSLECWEADWDFPEKRICRDG